jgi:chitin disaccharide deacetylase
MTEPAARPVILCADDFAVHEGASQGIALLAAQQRISATSAMVLSPRWPQDVALLREHRAHLDVGLHLDWTSEFALASGHGLSLGQAMCRAVLGGFDPVAARQVIEHQLDLFEAQWQAPPDHVDGHQHVQQFAGIRQALVAALAQRYGGQGGRLPYVRVSRPPSGPTRLKDRVIAAMGANAIEKIANKLYLPCAKGLLGIYDFSGGQVAYAQAMAHWLTQAPPGSIVMCHPALSAPADDSIGAARMWEQAHLASADFSNALAQAGVRLARGRDSWVAR